MAGFVALVIFTVSCAVILPVTVSQSQSCAGFIQRCVYQRTQQMNGNDSFCSVSQNYHQCLAYALSEGARTGICSQLYVWTFRAGLEATSVFSGCSYELEWQSVMDSCQRKIADCGRIVLSINPDNATENNDTTCRQLQSFKTCMDNATASCYNWTMVSQLTQAHLSDFKYETTCLGVTSVNASYGTLRLVNGSRAEEGRVEIFINGDWGTVCDDYWDDNDARVVCSQLGFNTSTARAFGYAPFGRGHWGTRIWLDDVRCAGHETRLLDCPASPVGRHNCGHSEDAGVSCVQLDPCASNPCRNGAFCINNGTGFHCNCPNGTLGHLCQNVSDAGGAHGSLRLVNGSRAEEGRVEIFVNGTWGTVCDDHWDDNDARVVCRQLGFNTSEVRAYSNARFGRGHWGTRIWLDDVRCAGNETRLLDCPASPVGRHNCGHSEDAGVSCVTSANGTDFMGNGSDEYYYFYNVTSANGTDFIGNGSLSREDEYYYFNDVTSSNGTDFIGNGSDEYYYFYNVTSGNGTDPDMYPTVNGSFPQEAQNENAPGIRLTGGSGAREGRVEVLVGGQWGTVCDDLWGLEDARVVCRELGYSTSTVTAYGGARFGPGSSGMPIWLDDVMCVGTETSLLDCPARQLGTHNCAHWEDAGVTCGDD